MSDSDLFTGLPSSVAGADLLVESIEQSVDQAIQDAMDAARAEIQSLAAADPEWAPYADMLDLEYVDEEFHYILTGDPERIEEALAIEYGSTEGRSPNSIIRKLALRQPAAIGVAITKQLEQEGDLFA